ncbi:Lrp/AsnC family transcriptional regulator [Glaciimonas sp. PCH181]|uniref:Lrp/AsnC family transcriptional regulator n=1 Tax=Glaciimonas sp. PCH181 TaxID=2133943 RepID=UPI000D3D5FF6|nr:Lrp/AsnC family transcriptional regulator [Glaciimonas sp. PCH181]PUA18933.1 AsnC family transcriptional regulator [Glaciimonas sp. PCH181]
MSALTVDRFDLQLLAELQQDGHATNSVLSGKIHLSTSQVSRRVQRLEEGGIIDHYAAILDPVAVGLHLVAFTHVTLDRQGGTSSEKFEHDITKLPEVLECFSLAGDADYMLRIVTSDLTSFSEFMTMHLLRLPGVTNVKSNITLRKIKQTTILPLDHVMQPTENKQRIQYSSLSEKSV